MTPKFPLENMNVLVTGGGSGIGLACAASFYRDGANVTLMGRSEQRLAEARAALEAIDVLARYRSSRVMWQMRLMSSKRLIPQGLAAHSIFWWPVPGEGRCPQLRPPTRVSGMTYWQRI